MPRRIAIVTQAYHPTVGGVTEHVDATARVLRSRGHHVTVITSRHPLARPEPDVVRVGRNLTVRYNLSVNDARRQQYGAIDFWNGNGGNGIRDVAVYNNTVYVTPSAGAAPKALRFISGTTNVSVRNNIFQTTGGVRLADIQAKQTNLQIQGNAYWSSGAPFSLKVFAKTYTSFNAYVSGSGHEKLNGVDIPKTGRGGRLGIMVTKTLLWAGERGPLVTVNGQQGSWFRGYDKATGAIVSELLLPANTTGVPMTYMVNNKQYIVVSVSAAGRPAELVAMALP